MFIVSHYLYIVQLSTFPYMTSLELLLYSFSDFISLLIFHGISQWIVLVSIASLVL